MDCRCTRPFTFNQDIRADTISIEKAALETLAYSDIFEYPLRIEEIHRYLSVRATLPDLQDTIDRQPELIGCLEDYYFSSETGRA